LEKGYHRIFWGLFIASFNIRLGYITILPSFIGWIFFFSGLSSLNENSNTYSFNKAQKYGIALIVVSLFTTVGVGFSNLLDTNNALFLLLPIIPMLLEIGLVFNVLEGSKEALENIGHGLAGEKLIRDSKTYLLFMGLSVLLMIFSLAFDYTLISFISAGLAIIARVYLLFVFSDLKKVWREYELTKETSI